MVANYSSLHLSSQTHSGGRGCCGNGDGSCVYLLLVAIDIELQGGAVGANVNGDIGAHHKGEIYIAMTAGEAAKHGDVVMFGWNSCQ